MDPGDPPDWFGEQLLRVVGLMLVLALMWIFA